MQLKELTNSVPALALVAALIAAGAGFAPAFAQDSKIEKAAARGGVRVIRDTRRPVGPPDLIHLRDGRILETY